MKCLCHLIFFFSMVIWQQTDMVILQFGLCQDISNPSYNLDKLHHIDMRRHSEQIG